MSMSRKSARLAMIIPILLALLSLTVFGTSCVGDASAQETTEIATADLDSLTSAFYLLKFDYDLLDAKYNSTVKADSLQLASTVKSYESMMQFERDKRKRDLWTIGVTAVLTGVTFYFARTVD